MSNSFYERYNLVKNPTIDSSSKNVNILKKDFTLSYSDYQKLKIAEQYNKLYSKSFDQNKINYEINENEKIYNLSLNELIKKAGPVYISLLNDLSIYFSDNNNEKSMNKLGYILTKNHNLLYIGLLIIIIAFFLWIIEITR
jgi:hypothetical protein